MHEQFRSVSTVGQWSQAAVVPPLEPVVEPNDLERRVLVVAERADARLRLGLLLQTHGLATHLLEDSSEILATITRTPIDLALLALGSSDPAIPELCEAIRRVRPNLPLFVLAEAPAEDEHVAALEAGADDYLAASVSGRQLVLRVQGALRRMGIRSTERLQHGGIVVELATHRVFAGGQEVNLTSTEYRLVQLFLRNPGQVFTRRYLLDSIWNVPSHVITRTVDTHVKRLRQKLGTSGTAIETVRGIGYRCGTNEAAC